jgi:hypothetical protein
MYSQKIKSTRFSRRNKGIDTATATGFRKQSTAENGRFQIHCDRGP